MTIPLAVLLMVFLAVLVGGTTTMWLTKPPGARYTQACLLVTLYGGLLFAVSFYGVVAE